MSDAISQFCEAIKRAGLPVPEKVQPDGALYRFSTNGKTSDTSGWYILHVDGVPAGHFGCWRSGISKKWRADIGRKMTDSEKRHNRRIMDTMRQQRGEEKAQRQEEAAIRAAEIWAKAQSVTEHPYLYAKGVDVHGLRCAGNDLIIPIRDSQGQLRSLQYISRGGSKRFLFGGQVLGCYYLIGTIDDKLCICEGFATGASVHQVTGHAVVVAFNAGNLKPVAEAMRAHHATLDIVIVADNDVRPDGTENTGIVTATKAAAAIGAKLAVPELDGTKCDFNDLHKARGPDAVWNCLNAATNADAIVTQENIGTPAIKALGNREKQAESSDKHSVATTLVEMALEAYDFGISPTGELCAAENRSKNLSMLRGSKTSLRGQLARSYFGEYGRAAAQQALADALMVIEGIAQESNETELHLRVASRDDELWLDLGDSTGRAICVTASGWGIEKFAPMLFKRTVLNGALPEPVQGGDLAELWSLLNVTEEDRPLLAAWLIGALLEDIPHPVLGIFGEQGTGKTTAQKMIVMAIDPGPVPTRKPPRDPESWVTAAAGSWLVGLDNLSDVRPWLSDSICRAVTGEGDVRRKLYTDGEHAVFAFRRCICLNGIDLGATRGDLGERMLPINLERISESNQQTEDDLWVMWRRNHPKILGAILDLASRVLSVLRSVELATKPRMADFARIAAAVDAVEGSAGLKHYLTKQGSLAADSLTGDPFILAVMELSSEGLVRQSCCSVSHSRNRRRNWPPTPRTVTTRLRRHAPAMTRTGWRIISDDGKNHDKVMRWSISPPEISSFLTRKAREPAQEEIVTTPKRVTRNWPALKLWKIRRKWSVRVLRVAKTGNLRVDAFGATARDVIGASMLPDQATQDE